MALLFRPIPPAIISTSMFFVPLYTPTPFNKKVFGLLTFSIHINNDQLKFFKDMNMKISPLLQTTVTLHRVKKGISHIKQQLFYQDSLP